MTRRAILATTLWGLALAAAIQPSAADTAIDTYKAAGIKPEQVLAGTVVTAQVVPGQAKQVVAVTTYLTGKHEKEAVEVRLDVYNQSEKKLTSLYTRSFSHEKGGDISEGNLELLDLNGDGVKEMFVSFKSFENPLLDQRLAEVITYDASGFRTAWSGPLEYDATRDARDVPPERRDRFRRILDIPRTLQSRGASLCFRKQMIAVAGERLEKPKVVQETFPFH